jgi:hypothetical protein
MLLAIALLHQLVGLVIGFGFDPSVGGPGPAPLVAMAGDGWIGSVGADPWRAAITWFLLWGFLLALVGLLAHQTERAGGRLPASFGAAFGALCVVGIVLMPMSGFWLGFGPAWIAIRRARATGPR